MVVTILRVVHISAGVVALGTFLIPLLSRKGGPGHRRAGWVYVSAMGVICVSALLTCLWRLAFDPRPEARDFAVFLAYLSVLAGNAARTGLRVLRFKSRTEPHTNPLDLGLPLLVLAFAAGLLAWGVRRGEGMFVGFAVVGFFASIRALLYWRKRPSTARHFQYQHMQSMVGSCVATLSAFLVLNARSLGVPPRFMILA